MIKHFEKQLENTEPLTEESIAALKQGRIDAGYPTTGLDSLQPGDKILFMMIVKENGLNPDGSKAVLAEIVKITDTEVRAGFLDKGYEFTDLVGSANIPRFNFTGKQDENA